MAHIVSRTTIALMTLVLASACSEHAFVSDVPPGVYFDRGSPESLLDVSSEIVNLDVSNDAALDELNDWIEQDQPSSAELYCFDTSSKCVAAQDILDLYGVPFEYFSSPEETVTLIYERVLARDCENRFMDNTINPHNLNHPTFGCSQAVNMVQMISDKQQIVRPNLMDKPDATKAVQAYQNYLLRREVEEREGIENSLLQNLQLN